MELAGERVGFFEMVPMQELQTSLRQALQYVVNIMVTHYDRLVPLRYHTREIVLGIEVLIQTFYLVRSKATYSEAFYSLKRSFQTKKGGLKELSGGLIAVSVFMEAIMPYLREKMEQNERSLVFKIFVRVMSVVKFAYQFAYLLTEISYFKPYLNIFSILIRRQNSYEMGLNEKRPLFWRILSQYNIFFVYLFKVYCEWYFR